MVLYVVGTCKAFLRQHKTCFMQPWYVIHILGNITHHLPGTTVSVNFILLKWQTNQRYTQINFYGTMPSHPDFFAKSHGIYFIWLLNHLIFDINPI